MLISVVLYLFIGLVINASFLVWNWHRFESMKGIHFAYQMFSFFVALFIFIPFWPFVLWFWSMILNTDRKI